MKPQKHAALIHLWADGAEIEVEFLNCPDEWMTTSQPEWAERRVYRVKPKPDVVVCRRFKLSKDMQSFKNMQCLGSTDTTCPESTNIVRAMIGPTNAKLTFDGETGELKGCEFIPKEEQND